MQHESKYEVLVNGRSGNRVTVLCDTWESVTKEIEVAGVDSLIHILEHH